MEKIYFTDIAGYEDEKKVAKKAVDYLKNYENLKANGASLPKGMVLYGEPGVGKTMMAKAIATEAGVPFIDVGLASVSHAGGMIDRFKEAFQEAKAKKPSILFLDELDQLIGRSGMTDSDEKRRLTDYLLQAMDGSETSEGVFVIATANRVFSLPKPLLRSGRMDLSIHFHKPDQKNRAALFKLYLAKSPYFRNISGEKLAEKTETLSCADISAITNAVLLACIMENREATEKDFQEKIIPILRKDITRQEEGPFPLDLSYYYLSQFVVCYDSGHSAQTILVLKTLPGHMFASGFYNESQSEENILARIRTYLAGKAGVELFAHKTSINAGMDLENASGLFMHLAKAGYFGFSCVSLNGVEDGEALLERKSQEQTAFFTRLYKEDQEILKRREPLLRLMLPELVKKGRLEAEEIKALVSQYEKTIPESELPKGKHYPFDVIEEEE